MFYYLSGFRDLFFAFNIFRYITFRSGMAAITTFVLCVIFGPLFIRKFKERSIHEDVQRKDCPQLDTFHGKKKGTPTMGGLFIIGSIVLSVLLWADLGNQYVQMTLLTMIALAVLGCVDDTIKLRQKKGAGSLKMKRGLGARTKLFWQCALGLVIGWFAYTNPAIAPTLEIPFFKALVLNLGIFYVLFAILVIVGSSNAVNLTDGLDGLAIGCVLIVSMTFSILCYISGHMTFSQYLFIPFLPGAGELTVICAAMLGASLGFLWFNCYPATIFMGDVGSLSLGGTIGVIAIFIKKEMLLVLAGGIFVVEALSVILQVVSFKTRRKRLFKVSPLHHHLQLSGWDESKIIIRFWISAIILALITLTTLKIR